MKTITKCYLIFACVAGFVPQADAVDVGTIEKVFQRAIEAQAVEKTVSSGKFLEAEAIADLELLAQSPDLKSLLGTSTDAFRFLSKPPHTPAWSFLKNANDLNEANLCNIGVTFILVDGRKSELVNWLIAQGADVAFKQAKPRSPGSSHPLDDIVRNAAQCGPRTFTAVMKAIPRDQLKHLDAGEPMASIAAMSWLFGDGIGCFQPFAEEGVIGAGETERAFAAMVANQVAAPHMELDFGQAKQLGSPAGNAAKNLDVLVQLTGGVPESALKQAVLDGNTPTAIRLAKATAPGEAANALQAVIAAKLESPNFPATGFAEIRKHLEQLGERDLLTEKNLPKGKAYFVGHDPLHGDEIRVTDGSTAGTQLLVDLVEGPASSKPDIIGVAEMGVIASVSLNGSKKIISIDPVSKRVEILGADCRNPEIRISLPGGAVFFADPNGRGWVTEGTRERTWQIAGNSAVRWAKFENGRCLIGGSFQEKANRFSGIVELGFPYRSAKQLLKSDEVGHLSAASISIGPKGVFLSGKWLGGHHQTTQGFAELIAVHRPNLPSGNPGAVQLQKIHPKRLRCSPLRLTSAWVGERFYFCGELLESDFDPASGSKPSHSTGIELMSTDGTATGTRLAADLSEGNSWPSHLVNVKGSLVFAAADGDKMERLWKLTESGKAEPLSGRIPATSHFLDPVLHDGKAYFVFANQLWCSDGNPGDTRMVHRFDGQIVQVAAANGCLLVQTLPEGHQRGNPIPLWRIDDNSAGVLKLAVMPMGPIYHGTARNPETPVNHAVETPSDQGTPEAAPKSASAPAQPAAFRNFRVIYSASSPDSGDEPHVFDSLTGLSTRLVDINPGPEGSQAGFGAVGEGKACFWAFDEVNGWRIWSTDGTSQGTKALPLNYGKQGDVLHYRSGHGATGTKLLEWRDTVLVLGDSAGSKPWQLKADKGLLVPIKLPNTPFHDFVLTQNRMFGVFGGRERKTPFSVSELFLNGSPCEMARSERAITSLVAPYVGFSLHSHSMIYELGDQLIIINGSGVRRLNPKVPGIFEPLATHIKVEGETSAMAGGRIVFSGSEIGQRADGRGTFAKHGAELYVADGTHGGTHLLKDLLTVPGDKIGSQPHSFTPCGDRAALVAKSSSATPGKHDLWVTDGTDGGTIQLMEFDQAPTLVPMAGGVLIRSNQGLLWTNGDQDCMRTLFPGDDPKIHTVRDFHDGAVLMCTVRGKTGFWWWQANLPEAIFCGEAAHNSKGIATRSANKGFQLLVIPGT